MKIKFFLVFILFSFFIRTTEVFALNQIYFDPEESVVGLGEPFLLALKIDASEPINALSLEINLPTNFKVVDFLDADSVINYWIERPFYDSKDNSFKLAGLIPGGFVGKGARLGILKIEATQPGVSLISFDFKSSEAYLDSPQPKRAILKLSSLDLRVVSGKENLGHLPPDTYPPEYFRPEIGRYPETDSPWHIFFQAQDKDSGILNYKLAESKKSYNDYENLEWREVVSPEILSDQSLRSFIYVKAVDRAGQERVVKLEPINKSSWFVYNLHYIIVTAILGLVFWIYRKNVYKKNKS